MAEQDGQPQPEESADESALQNTAPVMRPSGWNIRDIAEVDPERLLSGRVYRSSQVFRCVCTAGSH